MTTFNTGLAHGYVDYAKERSQFLSQKLKEQKSDFYCLQEVWKKEDRDHLIESLKEDYPYSFYKEEKNTRSENAPTCSLYGLLKKGGFLRCLLGECGGATQDQKANCVLSKCQGPLRELKEKRNECALSLMSQVGKSQWVALWELVNPFRGASLFTYEGQNGLLILSKTQFQKSKVIDLSEMSTLVRRSALQVEIQDTVITCTHLSANLRNVPYTGQFDSWERENLEQIGVLLSHIPEDKKSILLGDFNTGPHEIEKNYHFLLSKGLTPTYKGKECSFCQNNSLVKEKSDVLIDHIFIKNLKESAFAIKRVFTQKIPIKNNLINLSDHYGFELNIIKN